MNLKYFKNSNKKIINKDISMSYMKMQKEYIMNSEINNFK